MSTKAKLLDTNYLIYLSQVEQQEFDANQTFLSRISFVEYLSAKFLSDEDAEYAANRIESDCTLLEVTKNIGILAAKIRRHDKSVRIGDAIIMATSLVYDLELMTFDKRLLKALAYHKRRFSKKK